MNNQAIRQQLNNIQTIYGNRISNDITSNLKLIDLCQNRIRQNHSGKTEALKINPPTVLSKKEYLGKRVPSLEEVLNETKSETGFPSRKKKFIQSKDDLCIIPTPVKIQQNEIDTVSSPRLRENKLLRCRITNIIANDWSSTEEQQFYRGLEDFGMDFSRISTFKLPHRTTKEIHKCFAREDSKNQKRIDKI